jgi:hypothetical protein
MEGIKKLTESSKTVKEIMQELIDDFTQSVEEAEIRRKAASAKWELYKIEYADGEKHAYEDAAKKLKAVLDKM